MNYSLKLRLRPKIPENCDKKKRPRLKEKYLLVTKRKIKTGENCSLTPTGEVAKVNPIVKWEKIYEKCTKGKSLI